MSNTSVAYKKFAEQLRHEGNLKLAGDYYTSAAYDRLRGFRWPPEYFKERSPESPNVANLGWGLQKLLLGTLCYRLDGNEGRAENRARQDILIVEDVRQYEDLFQTGPRQGWCHEVIGDFQLIGDLDGFNKSYESAAKQYSGTENQIGWQAESEFEFFIQPVIIFANSVDYELDEKTEIAIRRRSLADRIAYKRNQYPEIIDQIIRAGNWEGV